MSRLLYIDILKGWSILCIVFLHYEKGVIPSWTNTWIGFFMISAFYFTSGWLTGIRRQEQTIKELATKRWQSLGKPYVYFFFFFLIYDFFLWAAGYYDIKFIARELYKTITLRGIGTLWFLPALFGGEIIFRFLLNNNKILLVFIAIALSLTYLHYYNIWLVKYRNLNEINQLIDAPLFTFRKILSAWPVIGIAYLLSKYFSSKLTELKPIYLLLIGITITAISIYICGGFCPISFGDLSPLIVPVIGPLGLLLLAYHMKKGIITRFLSFWGVNSLVMMVTHYSITMVICRMIDNAIFHAPFTGIRTLAWFVITIIASYPMVWFFNHKARWMLGKN